MGRRVICCSALCGLPPSRLASLADLPLKGGGEEEAEPARKSLDTTETYRRKIGDRYASTTVVSPRPTSLISGETSWLTETCAKSSSRARAATCCSCSG